MSWLEPNYSLRKGWGHVVALKDPYQNHSEFGSIVDYETVDAILEWASVNSGGTRISYDTWKFRSRNEAEQFIMLYKLTWA